MAHVQLMHDDELFRRVLLDRERRAGAEGERRIGLLHRMFDVLRIVITAADDDQVFDAAGDEEFAVEEESEVARPQKRTVAVGQVRAERVARLLRHFPIARRHARALHPNFADDVGRRELLRLRIDDHDPLAAGDRAVSHQRPCVGRIVGDRHDAVLLKRRRLKAYMHGRAIGPAAGDHQRRFGQAVARIKRLATETAGTERLGEAFERFMPYRLGAAEGHFPATQIQLRALLRRDAVDAQVVGKIGAAAYRGPILRNSLQPAHGALNEGDRRHDHGRTVGVDRLNDAADEAHVVVRR